MISSRLICAISVLLHIKEVHSMKSSAVETNFFSTSQFSFRPASSSLRSELSSGAEAVDMLLKGKEHFVILFPFYCRLFSVNLFHVQSSTMKQSGTSGKSPSNSSNTIAIASSQFSNMFFPRNSVLSHCVFLKLYLQLCICVLYHTLEHVVFL